MKSQNKNTTAITTILRKNGEYSLFYDVVRYGLSSCLLLFVDLARSQCQIQVSYVNEYSWNLRKTIALACAMCARPNVIISKILNKTRIL